MSSPWELIKADLYRHTAGKYWVSRKAPTTQCGFRLHVLVSVMS